MRHLHHLFTAIFISAFLFVSLIVAPQVQAGYEPPTGQAFYELLTKNKSLQDYGKEFCDKRSGDLMNLETWFSGKCGPTIDTLSGDGIGFTDIITLQGIETLIGPQQKGLIDQLVDLGTLLLNIKNVLGSNNGQTIDQKLAIIKSQTPKNSGLLAQATNLMGGLLLTKPAGTIDYIAYVSSNLQKHQIINQALAAGPGYGFTSLSPILPLWKAFRNVAYLLFAFGFVLYGIMIMFRIKIDAKTAASVQLAIPKLIITLILITFSYAIVGFLVDVSTFVTYLGINVLAVGGILNLSWLTGQVLVPIVGGISVLGGIGSMFVNTAIALIITPFILVSLIVGPFATIIGTVVAVAGVVSGIGLIISIIIILAILISYTKLILKLFEAFFSVIINLIFAPIILLGNIMPGSNAVSSWLLSIFGNLAVFPVAVFFLVLSYALMVQPIFGTLASLAPFIPSFPPVIAGLTSLLGVNKLSDATSIWAPPMTFSFVGANGDILLAAIGFGLLLMSSKYVDMVRDALKVPPFKYGTAIGEALRYGYNQTGDKNSGFRKSRLGPIADFGEGQYSAGIGKITGREMFQDASGVFGEPKAK